MKNIPNQPFEMAPVKRKSPAQSNGELQNKRLKQEGPQLPVRSKVAETETDSDPLVESDTTSQSGDDDGVDWPSDDEPDEKNQWNGGEEQDEEENVGVSLTAQTGPPPRKAEPRVNDKPEGTADSTLRVLRDTNTHEGSTSRESRVKQKEATKERKAAKPNADSVARSKKLWERLRLQSHVPLEERKVLIAELFDIITGHMKDFVFKHDSVRVIQTALKYANQDQKKLIATELKGEYKTLSQSKYAKFLVGKLLSYGDKEIRDMIVPEFYGSVRALIKHPEASWILDDTYRGAASSTQKTALLREWYGPEYAIFKSTGQGDMTADLKIILANNPEKRKPIMRSLFDLVNVLIQKKTTAFTMLHDAMFQYYINLQPGSEEATSFIELLKSDEEHDLLKNLAFTKSGAHLVCLVLAHSTAKDRKLLLRAYKNTIQMMTYDTWAHQILLTAYDVLDDTVLASKLIFPELLSQHLDPTTQQQNLLSQISSYTARIPLLYLSAGNPKAYLPAADLDLLFEIHAIRTTTSKKDPLLRRQELLTHLSPTLLSLIATHTKDLVSSSYGCQFITETILSASVACVKERQAALEALTTLVRESEVEEPELPKNGADKDGQQEAERDLRTLLSQHFASRMLKNLVQGGRFDPKTKTVVPSLPELGFSEMLFQALQVRKSVLVEWATGAQSFVIVAMVEAEGFQRSNEVRETLRKQRGRFKEVAGDDEIVVKKEGKRAKKGKEEVKGNMGSRLLLGILD